MSGTKIDAAGVPGLHLPPALFGEFDLLSPREIRAQLNAIRRVSRVGATDLEDIAEMVEQVLADNLRGVPLFFGTDVKRKAARIAEPLRHAVGAYDAGARLAVLAWQRFQHELGPMIEAEQQRANHKPRRRMDWADA